MRGLAFAFLLLAGAADAQDSVPAPASPPAAMSAAALRELPISCRPGELERQPGKTFAQLFGADWPAREGAVTLPHVTELGRLSWPSGMEGKRARVIVAVLVDADGAPLRVEPLCASIGGFDHAAHRAAMAGRYQPGTIDGQAAVVPVVTEVDFVPPRRRASGRADDAGASSGGD